MKLRVLLNTEYKYNVSIEILKQNTKLNIKIN